MNHCEYWFILHYHDLLLWRNSHMKWDAQMPLIPMSFVSQAILASSVAGISWKRNRDTSLSLRNLIEYSKRNRNCCDIANECRKCCIYSIDIFTYTTYWAGSNQWMKNRDDFITKTLKPVIFVTLIVLAPHATFLAARVMKTLGFRIGEHSHDVEDTTLWSVWAHFWLFLLLCAENEQYSLSKWQ